MRVQSLGREDTLEQSTAIHSSILVWRIPMDREAWWATVRGVSKKDTTEATHTQLCGMFSGGQGYLVWFTCMKAKINWMTELNQ